MEEEFDEILTLLLDLKNGRISELKYEEGKFSFKFFGGLFLFIKVIAPDLNSGYLKLYHETPFQGGNQLIELKDFTIKIEKNTHNIRLRIKNHLNSENNLYSEISDVEGFVTVDYEGLLTSFPKQLVQCIKKNNFEIYLK